MNLCDITVRSAAIPVSADEVTSQFVADICASFQRAVTVHLAMRVQRALVYCKDHFPHVTHLVREWASRQSLTVMATLSASHCHTITAGDVWGSGLQCLPPSAS